MDPSFARASEGRSRTPNIYLLCARLGSDQVPVVYKTTALPMSYERILLKPNYTKFLAFSE